MRQVYDKMRSAMGKASAPREGSPGMSVAGGSAGDMESVVSALRERSLFSVA